MAAISKNKFPLKYAIQYLRVSTAIQSSEDKTGIAKDDLEDYSGAIADYDKAIELNPMDASLYINRGLTKGDLQDHEGEISDYNKAIELNPMDPDVYLNRGSTKKELGDLIGACADWKKAAELGDKESAEFFKEHC